MNPMKRIQGILGLLIFICLFTTVFNGLFVTEGNLYNITDGLRLTALSALVGHSSLLTAASNPPWAQLLG